MKIYKLKIKNRVQKELKKIPNKDGIRLAKAINKLRQEPRPRGCEKLTGGEREYRIRVGKYRILYEIQEAVLVIVVVRVAHRRKVYEASG